MERNWKSLHDQLKVIVLSQVPKEVTEDIPCEVVDSKPIVHEPRFDGERATEDALIESFKQDSREKRDSRSMVAAMETLENGRRTYNHN